MELDADVGGLGLASALGVTSSAEGSTTITRAPRRASDTAFEPPPSSITRLPARDVTAEAQLGFGAARPARR